MTLSILFNCSRLVLVCCISMTLSIQLNVSLVLWQWTSRSKTKVLNTNCTHSRINSSSICKWIPTKSVIFFFCGFLFLTTVLNEQMKKCNTHRSSSVQLIFTTMPLTLLRHLFSGTKTKKTKNFWPKNTLNTFKKLRHHF